MKNFYAILISSVIAITISFFGLWLIYNYLPMDRIDLLNPVGSEEMFGTTVTTISGSDTLKDSRTTINDNFTALNNGKIETSTTSVALIITLSNLTTVGTLTSGALGSGFSVVSVPLGGTGSTTLSVGQLLIGSSTNAIGVVSGHGTSGQLLQSRGSNLSPIWASPSIDTGVYYDWTGLNTWGANSISSTTFSFGVEGSFTATSTMATTTITSLSITSLSINSIDIDETKYTTLTTASTSEATDLHYHADSCATGQATKAKNITGTQEITHGLGVIPTYFSINAMNSGMSAFQTSFGTATGTEDETSTWSFYASISSSLFGQDAADIIHFEDVESHVTASAQLSAVTSTTFTLNWDANLNEGGTRYFQWTVCK